MVSSQRSRSKGTGRVRASLGTLAVLLALLPAARHAGADVVFDFSGSCEAGDCEQGTVWTAELRFSDDADLSHGTRSVTAADFVSLVIEFAPVGRARATAQWSPTTAATLVLPLTVVIGDSGALVELLLRDELKNLFRVDATKPSGEWEYRQVRIDPEGTVETDLGFSGTRGSFDRRLSVPEPGTFSLLGWIALALLRRRGTVATPPSARHGG